MWNKPLERMTDEELSRAIEDCINNKEPESIRLDYKQELKINKDAEKKELAKDISSFANEQGGVLIYGVPEVDDCDLPRPAPLHECGINIESGIPERIESILLSTIQPPLHSLMIRVVNINKSEPNKLLVVYHPESYWKPHMVAGYKDGRYYRRSNYQSVLMNEREVEAAYLAREAARAHARDFLTTASFGDYSGVVLRIIACPILRGHFKEKLLEPNIKDWLIENSSSLGPDWRPFLEGWRFLSNDSGNISGKEYEIRLFHNGAICLNLDGRSSFVSENLVILDGIRERVSNFFAESVGPIFESLGVHGMLTTQISLTGINGLGCMKNEDECRQLDEPRTRLQHGMKHARFVGELYSNIEDLERRYRDSNPIVFEEEFMAGDLLDQPDNVLDRIILRIGTAFGIWG